MVVARDLISRRVVVVRAEERLGDVVARLQETAAHHCIVLHQDRDEVLGVLRLADLAARPGTTGRIFADLVPARLATSVRDDLPGPEVARLYAREAENELVVLDGGGRLVGLITAESLSRWLLDRQRLDQERIADALEEQKRLATFLERKLRQRTLEWCRSVDDFHRAAVTLSHDVRRPLRSIHSLAGDLLGDDCGMLNERGREAARQIERCSLQLEHLANEILGKAQDAFAGGPAPVVAIDLGEVFADAVTFLHSLIRERNATVAVRPPMHRVVGRYVPMLQIAVNLLTNAIKHVPGDREPAVAIWSELDGSRVRLCVKDNAGGLGPRDHAALFQPFVTFGAQRSSESGLGLAITRNAIAQLGGGISVTSEEGVGSQFTVTLPPAS